MLSWYVTNSRVQDVAVYQAFSPAVQIEDEEPSVSCSFGLFGGGLGSWGKAREHYSFEFLQASY